MRVKFNWDYFIEGVRHSPGNVYDIAPAKAATLIKQGHCTEVVEDEEPKKVLKTSTKKKKTITDPE